MSSSNSAELLRKPSMAIMAAPSTPSTVGRALHPPHHTSISTLGAVPGLGLVRVGGIDHGRVAAVAYGREPSGDGQGQRVEHHVGEREQGQPALGHGGRKDRVEHRTHRGAHGDGVKERSIDDQIGLIEKAEHGVEDAVEGHSGGNVAGGVHLRGAAGQIDDQVVALDDRREDQIEVHVPPVIDGSLRPVTPRRGWLR